MEFDRLLMLMVEQKASDLFITVGVPPSIKRNGEMKAVTDKPLSVEQTRDLVLSVMNEKQRLEFLNTKELNFAISAKDIGRFRCSAFYQRNMMGIVIRRIETQIPQIDDLGLPKVIKELSLTKRGLVIIVGATGSGKSTTLAGMIQHRNQHSKGHIITIEDPIEFVHRHQGCIITQREVGLDTESFSLALKNTLRQAPDVILIGEIRTRETMEHAIAFAETGHLCLSTLHANNANQALDRIMHFFPADQHSQLWFDLSMNLQGIVAQQLIQTSDQSRRRACLEVLLNTPLVSDMVRKGEFANLKEVMKTSTELGMQTFDQSLYNLYYDGVITYADALAHADSANDLRLMIKLMSESDADSLHQSVEGLSIEGMDDTLRKVR